MFYIWTSLTVQICQVEIKHKCGQGRPQNTLSAPKLWALRCEAAGAERRNIKDLRKSIAAYN